jgi:hypothetical protein
LLRNAARLRPFAPLLLTIVYGLRQFARPRDAVNPRAASVFLSPGSGGREFPGRCRQMSTCLRAGTVRAKFSRAAAAFHCAFTMSKSGVGLYSYNGVLSSDPEGRWWVCLKSQQQQIVGRFD